MDWFGWNYVGCLLRGRERNYFATFTDVAIIFIRFLPGIKLSVAGGPSNPLQKDRWWGTRLVPLSGTLVTDWRPTSLLVSVGPRLGMFSPQFARNRYFNWKINQRVLAGSGGGGAKWGTPFTLHFYISVMEITGRISMMKNDDLQLTQR